MDESGERPGPAREQPDDKDPEPTKHSDAERVTGDEDERAANLEGDPSRNPEDETLRDVKGG